VANEICITDYTVSSGNIFYRSAGLYRFQIIGKIFFGFVEIYAGGFRLRFRGAGGGFLILLAALANLNRLTHSSLQQWNVFFWI